MQLTVLKSKIHRARVTEAQLDYDGSLTIDETLLRAANIRPYEQVAVYNLANGKRFETYAIPGAANSGTICVNGAAAHLAGVGDLLIIAAYGLIDAGEALSFRPRIVRVDERNRVKNG
jgi:aspartate 1-decarboxylase